MIFSPQTRLRSQELRRGEADAETAQQLRCKKIRWFSDTKA